MVLLDHGLYKYLPQKLRVDYSYLWKGLITLDEEMLKMAIRNIGIDEENYRLFAMMVTAKDWDKIMDGSSNDVNSRLQVSMEKN